MLWWDWIIMNFLLKAKADSRSIGWRYIKKYENKDNPTILDFWTLMHLSPTKNWQFLWLTFCKFHIMDQIHQYCYFIFMNYFHLYHTSIYFTHCVFGGLLYKLVHFMIIYWVLIFENWFHNGLVMLSSLHCLPKKESSSLHSTVFT